MKGNGHVEAGVPSSIVVVVLVVLMLVLKFIQNCFRLSKSAFLTSYYLSWNLSCERDGVCIYLYIYLRGRTRLKRIKLFLCTNSMCIGSLNFLSGSRAFECFWITLIVDSKPLPALSNGAAIEVVRTWIFLIVACCADIILTYQQYPYPQRTRLLILGRNVLSSNGKHFFSDLIVDLNLRLFKMRASEKDILCH